MPDLKVLKAQRSKMSRAVEDYLTACRSRGVKPSTIRDGYGFPLRNVFVPWCEEEELSSPADLDRRTLERYAVQLREKGGRTGKPLSENTIWTYLKAVNQFLAWAAEEGEGLGAKVRLRKPPGRKIEVLERDEISALEREASMERDRIIIRLLADAGLRPGELISIRGCDIRRAGRGHYVVVRGKTGERMVPISPEMYRRLGNLARGEDEPVFVRLRRDQRTGEHEPLTVNGVRQMLHDLALNTGLGKQVMPYTFRHSACRWMLLKGTPTVVVGKILGHGSERMIAEHYANIGDQDAHDQLMALLRAEK